MHKLVIYLINIGIIIFALRRWGHGHDVATEALERDWERMTTFYHFPKEHGHLQTTAPVELPLAALLLRTDVANGFQEGGFGDAGDLEDADGGGTEVQTR